MLDHDPNRKGNIAELAIAAEAARLGLSVYKPLTEHERCDLVIGMAGKLLKVQCKWAKLRGGAVVVRLSTSRRGPEGHIRTTYSAGDVDAVGAYCDELGESFLIPIQVVAGMHTISLRLTPARNGQRAALNLAEKYRLGAVAQLAERRHGMAEARGSNPLSSINEPSSGRPLEEVGAHEFRNRFGYYLERAACGTEVAISWRGRPYARLGPAARRTARARRLPLRRLDLK